MGFLRGAAMVVAIALAIVIVICGLAILLQEEETDETNPPEDNDSGLPPSIEREIVNIVLSIEVTEHWSRREDSLPQKEFQAEIYLRNSGNTDSEPVTLVVYEDDRVTGYYSVGVIRRGLTSAWYTSITHDAEPVLYDEARTLRVEASPYGVTDSCLLDGALPRWKYCGTNPGWAQMFVTPSDPEVVSLTQSILAGKSVFEQRWMVLTDWVARNIEYRLDSEKHGGPYWQLPRETIGDGTGDCEDFSLLLVSMFRAAGWHTSADPRDVFVVIGEDYDGVGHAWAGAEVDVLAPAWQRWLMIEPQQTTGLVWSWVKDLMMSGYETYWYFNDLEFLSSSQFEARK